MSLDVDETSGLLHTWRHAPRSWAPAAFNTRPGTVAAALLQHASPHRTQHLTPRHHLPHRRVSLREICRGAQTMANSSPSAAFSTSTHITPFRLTNPLSINTCCRPKRPARPNQPRLTIQQPLPDMTTSNARIYTSAEARSSILKRGLIEDTSVPPHVQARIDEMFGKPTTPVQCVQNILRSVRDKGDEAVQYWTHTIDGVDISSGAEVPYHTIQASLEQVPDHVIEALRLARNRVVSYHKKQPVTSWFTNDLGGTVGQAIRPIERVGFYVPGGTAPLPSTVLMSVLPAVVAGCEQLIVVSPPDRKTGSIASVTLAACAVINELEGVKVRVFTVGGSQAIGALAYGTATIPRVDKIVGPGNIFVAIAKKEVYGVVGIDGIYGPTEAVVLADQHADAELVAADLLAQAEHDFMAVPILLTDSRKLAEEVQRAVDVQIEKLDRKEVAKHAMEQQGGLVVAESLDECVDLANEFATEHVSLSVEKPWDLVGKMKNAGGLFLGEGSCEVLGDYVAGPSHVMPTGGSARFSSPLSVVDFVKIVSVVGLDAYAVRDVARAAETIARCEGLDAHANAARLRVAHDS
ncbi:unnamed protein product [Agarophyton chilense]